MENATKALLMAAAVLISVVILSIGAYLFTYFADYSKGVEDDIRTNQIAQFNSQFLSYQGKNLTIYDVITLANLAKNYNQNNGYTQGNRGYITITPPTALIGIIGSIPPNEIDQGSPNSISEVEKEDTKLIGEIVTKTNDVGESYKIYELKAYKCFVTIDEVTKMVSTVSIQ